MPAPPDDDEERLLAAVRGGRAGGRAAGEALVGATYRRVYATLFRLAGGDADLAADLTQETYRKAWAALDGFDGRARLSTWLFRIAYTTFLNHARRPRLLPLAEADDGGGATPSRGAPLPPDPSPLPDEELADRRGREALRRAVLALPDELRFAVTARFWGELPVREIARQQGLTPMGVRKRLQRALARLAATLEEDPT